MTSKNRREVRDERLEPEEEATITNGLALTSNLSSLVIPNSFGLQGSARVLSGDCRQHMRDGTIPPRSVHCIVSSPPYWGLRDYKIPGVQWADGWVGVYGNEPTFGQYIVHTLELFEDLRRVLRPDGTIWWNLGDTFATGAGKGVRPLSGKHKYMGEAISTEGANRLPQGIADGNKLMIPYRVAIALQDAGWVVRMDNIWAKPGPMPESVRGWYWQRCKVKVGREPVKDGGLSSWDMGEHSHGESGAYRGQEKTVAKWSDCPGCAKCEANDGYVLRRGKWRCTNSHEVVLQITQPGDYFSDSFGVAEPTTGNAHSRGHGVNPKSTADCPLPTAPKSRQNSSFSEAVTDTQDTRNPRSVWKISSEAYKGAHFATYPTDLPYRCIQASTSPAGCCPTCGSQFAPVIVKERRPTRPGEKTKVNAVDVVSASSNGWNRPNSGSAIGNRDPQRHTTVTTASEYRPTCSCFSGSDLSSLVSRPSVVYDPFGGSGTTVQVCLWTGRAGICSEISEPYQSLIPDRLTKEPRCVRKAKAKRPRKTKKHKRQRNLFPSGQ